VVKLVDELGFEQGQQTFAWVVLKQVTVVRHVEHGRELDAPRVLAWLNQVFATGQFFKDRIAHEHGRGAVELFGDLGVAPTPKSRAREGIRIDEVEI